MPSFSAHALLIPLARFSPVPGPQNPLRVSSTRSRLFCFLDRDGRTSHVTVLAKLQYSSSTRIVRFRRRSSVFVTVCLVHYLYVQIIRANTEDPFFFLLILIRLISLADDRLPSAAPGVIQAVSLGFNPNLTARFLLSQINATHTTVRYGLGKECDPCVRAYITVAARLGYWITLSRPPYIYYVIHSQLADRDHMATYRRHTRENDRCPAPRHVVGTVKRAPLDGARRPADLCVVACAGNTALPAEHSRGGGGGGTGTGRSVGHTHTHTHTQVTSRRPNGTPVLCCPNATRSIGLVLALSSSVNRTTILCVLLCGAPPDWPLRRRG